MSNTSTIDVDSTGVKAESPFLPETEVQYARTIEELYARRLIKKAIVNGDCWECHLKPNPKGYCYISIGGRLGTKWRAHRLIWTVVNGEISLFGCILHTCDNRRCIRPSHLYQGTEADNTRDMISRGRDDLKHPRTDYIYREDILSLHQQGISRRDIADKLSISHSTVWNHTSPKGAYYDRG